MSNLSNTEELFRFASTRGPDPASRPDPALELADDADVPAWLAQAAGQDAGAELEVLSALWRRLTGRDPHTAFSDFQAAARGSQVLDLRVYFPDLAVQEYATAMQQLLTSLWKFYLQALSTGKASPSQLERGQEMIALASMLLTAHGDSGLAHAVPSPGLVRKLRLPAAFEASMQARRAPAALAWQLDFAGGDQRDQALRTQIAELDGLDQLAHRLASALAQFVPAAATLATQEPAGADAPAEMIHTLRPAEDVDATFWRANQALLFDLQEASIATAGVGVWQVLDQLRRLVADQVLAVTDLAPGPEGAKLIAAHPLLGRLPASAAPPAASAAPPARFGIRPLGIADLRVVRQRLLRYEKGELARIENVLQGEQRERYYTSTQRVEEGQSEWSERENENTRETQSGEFFSMGREARNTMREQRDESNGVSTTANYGDVQVSTSSYMSSSRSLEQSVLESAWQSRDIITRTADTVRERVGSQRFRSMLSEVQETIIERQSAEGANVTGHYRRVEKVYQAQVFNYGARAMYEIMLPKPAAMFSHLLAHAGQHGAIAGAAPVQPGLRPADITESTWAWFAAHYGLSLAPPPPSAITDYAHAGFGTQNSGVFQPALEGYQALWGGCSISWVGAAGQSGITASIGPRLFASSASENGTIAAQALGLDSGAIAFSASAWGNLQKYSVNLYLVRSRGRRALEQWQQACYQAIMDDYAARLAAWRAQSAAQTGSEAEPALSPGRMRSIERTELKRAILEIVRAGTGNAAPAPAIVLAGAPAIEVGKLELAAQEVRFFESAFEWDQMTYRFHPYFWHGAPAEWPASALVQQGDSVFSAFLNAGFASVVLPVRPGFEDAAALYFKTGLALELPLVPAEPGLAGMNHEVAQRNARPDEGVAEGEAWTYRVPTALVVLDDGTHNALPVLALEDAASGA